MQTKTTIPPKSSKSHKIYTKQLKSMDLLNRIYSEVLLHPIISSVVGGIIGTGILFLVGILFASFRKFLKSLPSKINSLITNVGSWDFIQRVFQTRKGIDHPSLEEYKQPFHDSNQWTRRFNPGITLSITVDDKTRTYCGVTKIDVRRSYPFNNFYELIITHSNGNRVNTLQGPRSKILKIIKQCYFRETVLN